MTLGLVPAWIIIYQEIKAMFERDDEVTVVYNNDSYTVEVYVNNALKAMALETLLKHTYTFGNVTLNVDVIPANKKMKVVRDDEEEFDILRLYKVAFESNPVLCSIRKLPDMILGGYSYMLFTYRPAQYFTDDLSCWGGVETKLYQDIAKDIFEPRTGVSFCTEKMENCMNNRY